MPMRKTRPAPLDRRRRGLRLGEHAGDAGAGVEQSEQEIGAPGIADPRRASGEANALDAREARQAPSVRKARSWPTASASHALKRSGSVVVLGVPGRLGVVLRRGLAPDRGILHRLLDLRIDDVDLGGVMQLACIVCLRLLLGELADDGVLDLDRRSAAAGRASPRP